MFVLVFKSRSTGRTRRTIDGTGRRGESTGASRRGKSTGLRVVAQCKLQTATIPEWEPCPDGRDRRAWPLRLRGFEPIRENRRQHGCRRPALPKHQAGTPSPAPRERTYRSVTATRHTAPTAVRTLQSSNVPPTTVEPICCARATTAAVMAAISSAVTVGARRRRRGRHCWRGRRTGRPGRRRATHRTPGAGPEPGPVATRELQTGPGSSGAGGWAAAPPMVTRRDARRWSPTADGPWRGWTAGG